MRVAFRCFVERKVEFEETTELADEPSEITIFAMVERHAPEIARHPLHMIEIEFLDERDQQQRYFRFGTDPRGMIKPDFILQPETPE